VPEQIEPPAPDQSFAGETHYFPDLFAMTWTITVLLTVFADRLWF
jgi:hypothetical protein